MRIVLWIIMAIILMYVGLIASGAMMDRWRPDSSTGKPAPDSDAAKLQAEKKPGKAAFEIPPLPPRQDSPAPKREAAAIVIHE